MKLEKSDELFKEAGLEVLSILILVVIFSGFIILLFGLGVRCISTLLS